MGEHQTENVRQRDDSSEKSDRYHTRVINSLKRELLELQKTLELERTQRRDRDARESESASNSPNALDQSHRLAADLELCKKELAATRQALDEACEEREALRVQLSTVQTASSATEDAENKADEALLRLDWVGSHYLAVTLPEDHMFKPGEPVTPAGVLHKLYEIRMGSRLATGFTVLLENINIMLSHTDPQWYAKHFGFRSGTRTHGNDYISADRIDADEFAWLLFEYGAHATLVEVLAGLQTVLSSTGKGGVTTVALCTGKSMYTAYVVLFRDTVSKAFERFERVRDRAYKVRKEQGVLYMSLTAGLGRDLETQSSSSQVVRSRALRSVIEGIEAPSHVSNPPADGVKHAEDPFKVGDSLSDFLTRKSRVNDQGKAGRVPTFTSQQALAYKSQQQSVARVDKRVVFDSPWP
ncbi:hypothetical protein ACER0C_003051 [Sarotherodon galilaeus]